MMYRGVSPLWGNEYRFNSIYFYKSSGFAWFTWFTSSVALLVGLLKFIRLSPFKTNKNILMDFLIHIGIVLRVFSLMTHFDTHIQSRRHYRILAVIGMGSLPALVNIITLVYKAGYMKIWKLFLLYPQILLSPIFTPFLYTYYDNKNQSSTGEGCSCTNSICCKYVCGGNVLSCCRSSIEVEGSSGFHIWTSASFLNYCYMILIPASIPTYQSYTYTYEFFKFPKSIQNAFICYCHSIERTSITIGVLMMVGIFYFWGSLLCKSCKCISPLRPSVSDPTTFSEQNSSTVLK